MRVRTDGGRGSELAVVGVILVLAGIGWFVLRELRLDPFEAIARAGWPFFVILPGVAFLLVSLIPPAPRGLGFAIAGSIVTTVGTVLFYQNATGHWESWAYAWALVGPGAAGLGMVLYGLIFRRQEIVRGGTRLVAIGAAVFVAGAWYFETIFETGRVPIEIGAWWPVVMVVIGLTILATAFARRGRGPNQRPTHQPEEV
jgi:hypothetical protein